VILAHLRTCVDAAQPDALPGGGGGVFENDRVEFMVCAVTHWRRPVDLVVFYRSHGTYYFIAAGTFELLNVLRGAMILIRGVRLLLFSWKYGKGAVFNGRNS
jgi:hypothetical protein